MNKVLAVGTEVIFTDGTTRLYSATQNYLEEV